MQARSTLARGPAVAVPAAGKYIYFKDDITAVDGSTFFSIQTSANGDVEMRPDSRIYTVSGVPVGAWKDLSILYPWLNSLSGSRLFPTTDAPLLLHGLTDSSKTQLATAALTKCPDLTLAADKTVFGALEWTCLGPDNHAWDTSGGEMVTFPTPAAFVQGTTDTADKFDPDEIISQPWIGNWGDVSGLEEIETQDGWTITTNVKHALLKTDTAGVMDANFIDFEVMIKCIPTNVTAALLQTSKQASGYVRGAPASVTGKDLTLTGADGKTVTITLATIQKVGYAFGNTVLRNGEFGFVANRRFTAGVPQPKLVFA